MHQFKKVIQLPCDPLEKRLEIIKSSLERSVLLHPQVIKNFQIELTKIANSICRFTSPEQKTKQNNLIQELEGRCHHLTIRKKVIDLAENAQELVENKDKKSIKQIQNLANTLQNKINNFNENHQTSRINAKFLRFANTCIQKARNNRPLINKKKGSKIIDLTSFEPKKVTDYEFEKAQDLYEIAHTLFLGKLEEFKNNIANLDPCLQKELNFHIHKCDGSLTIFTDQTTFNNTLRAILGYAHTITDYFTSCSAYPSDDELCKVFEDLKTL